MAIFDGRYEQLKLLGQGAFSEVWKVKDTQTGVILALKIYNSTTGSDDKGNEMLTHEFALMVNANHKNLLRPLFFASCDNRPYLILPYCEKGNIGKLVGKMSEEEAWKLLRDAASALSYLHTMNPPILHQDIKPANILLNDNGDYMLTDFGVSTQARQTMSRISNQEIALLSAGTIAYMAPERFSRNNLPVMANDIYSLGSTVFEMLSGELPFGNDGGLLQKKGADIPELRGDFSPLLKRTIEKCLECEPWARPTADRLEHIANEALRLPETRNVIPGFFSATSQDEVPASQLNAASHRGAQNMVPEVEDDCRKTVLGPAPNNPLHGTVIGAATPHPFTSNNPYPSNNSYRSNNPYTSNNSNRSNNPYTSNNSNRSNNPYTSNDPYATDTTRQSNGAQPEGKSKKGLWIGIAFVAVLAIVGGIYFLLGSGNAQESEVMMDPAEQKKIQQQAEFQASLNMFRQENPDSIKMALNRMKVLAYDGYPDAIFEIARTYAWVPNDMELDRRKHLLGWELREDGSLKGAPKSDEINREAIEWLQKSIDQKVPKFHQSLYWLAFYYYFALGTNEDIAKAKQMFEQAKIEAEKSRDSVFTEKIEKTLEQLN